MTDSTRDFFQTLAEVLLRCWMFGLFLLLLWFAAWLVGRDLLLQWYSELFEVPRDLLNLIFCCGVGLYKLMLLSLFFIPWAAIRFVLRREK